MSPARATHRPTDRRSRQWLPPVQHVRPMDRLATSLEDRLVILSLPPSVGWPAGGPRGEQAPVNLCMYRGAVLQSTGMSVGNTAWMAPQDSLWPRAATYLRAPTSPASSLRAPVFRSPRLQCAELGSGNNQLEITTQRDLIAECTDTIPPCKPCRESSNAMSSNAPWYFE